MFIKRLVASTACWGSSMIFFAHAIASESGAKPLLGKAEAMLNGLLAGGDQPT